MSSVHCDDVINMGFKYPICLRYFLLVMRLPAIEKSIIRQAVGMPECYATYKDVRVKLVMASRMGDVGITTNLEAESGYDQRVSLDQLSEFSVDI